MLGELEAGAVGQFQEALVEANYSPDNRPLSTAPPGWPAASDPRPQRPQCCGAVPHGALPRHGQPAGRVHGCELRPLRAGAAGLAPDGAVPATRPPDALDGHRLSGTCPRASTCGISCSASSPVTTPATTSTAVTSLAGARRMAATALTAPPGPPPNSGSRPTIPLIVEGTVPDRLNRFAASIMEGDKQTAYQLSLGTTRRAGPGRAPPARVAAALLRDH